MRNHTDMLYSSYIQFKKVGAYSITFETLKEHLKNKTQKNYLFLKILNILKYIIIYVQILVKTRKIVIL